MNLLFLTLLDFNSIDERNIYTDLLREFRKRGHNICVVSPVERRTGIKTHIINEGSVKILKLRIGNTQKTNIFEKGISTVLIETQYINGIKKYFSDIKFDLVLYATPPITLYKAIKFIKNRDNAKTYLMLKDIFPQNAVDLGMLDKSGFKGALYRYFRLKEKRLYSISDKIGCMSQANVEYILKHNSEISSQKVEISPNSIEPTDISIDSATRRTIRKKYGLPIEKKVFIYGGNLGKPQGIPFFIECLRSQENNKGVFFLIVGDGTEYSLIEEYVNNNKGGNVKLFRSLPKDDYDTLVAACDVGMIFLDNRFTIPNFPSRLLGYLQAKIPVLAVTDDITDVGHIAVLNGFGWAASSDNLSDFLEKISTIQNGSEEIISERGESGYLYLKKNYSAEMQAETIIRMVKRE